MTNLAKLIKVKKIVTPFEMINNGAIGINDNGKIELITTQEKLKAKADETINAENLIAVPGFIDIHTHGAYGHDVMEADPEKLYKITEFFASKGVTAFLPTTTTSPLEDIYKALDSIKKLMDNKRYKTKIIGAHLEGPYFSYEKAGAQDKRFLRTPNLDEVKQFLEQYNGVIKRVTLAPELENALEVIKYLHKNNVVVGIGHSAATYEEAAKAIDAGARVANHIYNGMIQLHHRKPGILGACLSRDDIYAEMIADGIHIHPAAMKIVVRCKTTEKAALITDSIMAAGLPDGEYMLGRQKIYIKNGKSTLEDGTIAGSTLTMDRAVKNAVELIGVSFQDAVKMASYVPAEILGIQNSKGAIKIGHDADIVLIDSNFEVKLTMREGEIIYSSL
ncbi:MAG: N-acetylglucosamine-6-phosphate deacetylase [Candidatus Njordarchaeia archaeon]